MMAQWQYDAWDAVVKSATDTVCRLHDTNGEDFADPITTKKNGRLLAAAPDLLAACKAIIREYDPETATGDWPTPDDFAEFCVERAREAIAKAEAKDA